MSDGQGIGERVGKLEEFVWNFNRGEREREILGNLRHSENFNAFSTIDMLKKQVELLDL